MTEDIVDIIARYGLETILIAVVVNILTAIIKLPIKYLANKTKHSSRITRFIVILPVVIGFVITLCYVLLINGEFVFGKEFVTLWLTSSSLSLTIYAVIEKMIPSKKTIIQDSETEMTEKIIGKIQSIADVVFNNEDKPEKDSTDTAEPDESNISEQDTAEENVGEQKAVEKIVLRGSGYVQTDIEN